MPRLIQIAVSADKADALLRNFDRFDGVLGISRQTGASIDPPGDIVTVQTTNETSRKVLAELKRLGVWEEGTILTSDLKSLLTSTHQKKIDAESNETIWEEMASLLQQDTNVSFNFLALMFLAGAIAATGLWVDKIHIVVGAMVIAPAFEPLLRMPFGMISCSRTASVNGAISTLAGYAATIIGAALALVLLRFFDTGAMAGTDLEARSWVVYWSTFTPPGIIASVFGAAAGAVVVCGLRSVLTTGVMVTLSLVPSISIVGMAIATADMTLAGKGFMRWLADAALVIVISAIVLGLKQALVHRRRSLGYPRRPITIDICTLLMGKLRDPAGNGNDLSDEGYLFWKRTDAAGGCRLTILPILSSCFHKRNIVQMAKIRQECLTRSNIACRLAFKMLS